MRLVEVRHNRWVVYTDDNKLVIQVSDSRIARSFLHGKDNSERDRPTEDPT